MAQTNALIIAFIDNPALITAANSGVSDDMQLALIESAETFGVASSREKLGEPLTAGQTANLTSHLSTKQPNLLIFDSENTAIPLDKWLPIVKTSPATRRIPAIVIVSGATPDVDRHYRGRGADVVVEQAAFVADSAEIIKTHIRQHDTVGISEGCAQPLSQLAIKGIELFNAGEYYDAHEELEHAWNADKSAARDFYRAILQIAVAYLQIERGNYRGAVKMILRVRQWLTPLPAICRGVNIGQLRADVEAVSKSLESLGADRIAEFDHTQFNQITFATQDE